YAFFALYANIDKFKYTEAEVPLDDRSEIDRWIISLLNTLVKDVENDYANYEATNATRRIQSFVNDQLSNWYVRLCRRRFWKGDYSQDKIAAYQTLYTCMSTITKLMAPVAPFIADWMFKNLNEVTGKETPLSVHLVDFPTAMESAIDKALEERMDYAQRISSLVLSLRRKEKIRVRQPLPKILLPILDESFRDQVEEVKDLILSEVNVKEIEYITDASGIIKKRIKPNFKTLGKRLGRYMKAASQTVGGFTQEDIAAIEKSGVYQLQADGENFELSLEDFEISTEDIPGWLVASDGALTVALDVTLTEALLAEGTAKELVKHIQNLRKSKDFNVTDKIAVTLEQHEAISNAVALFGDYICNEVLAAKLDLSDDIMGADAIDLTEEIQLKIQVILN
ncbi:MAG: isoleucyl-tRNA synthetase, partial [Saprospiraceae bacterium]